MAPCFTTEVFTTLTFQFLLCLLDRCYAVVKSTAYPIQCPVRRAKTSYGTAGHIQCPVFFFLQWKVHAHTATPRLITSVFKISPAPRKAQRSASTSNDRLEFSVFKPPTGIVLEVLVVCKLPQALPFGFRGQGAGLATVGESVISPHLNFTKSNSHRMYF